LKIWWTTFEVLFQPSKGLNRTTAQKGFDSTVRQVIVALDRGLIALFFGTKAGTINGPYFLREILRVSASESDLKIAIPKRGVVTREGVAHPAYIASS
jgi:hypothetical protein